MFKTCDEKASAYVDAHIVQLRTKMEYLIGLRDGHVREAQRLQRAIEQDKQTIQNMGAQSNVKQALLQKPCVCDREFRLVCAHCQLTRQNDSGTPEFMHYKREEDGQWCIMECWGRKSSDNCPRLYKDYPSETLGEALRDGEHYL